MSSLMTARGVLVRWGKPVRFAVRHVISAAVPGGSLIADAVDKVLECVQDTAEDHEKAEARVRTILGAQDLECVGSILDECNGRLAGLIEQVVKLEGLPESAERIILMADDIIRRQRATDARIQAGFANIVRFADQFDRIEAGVGRVEAKVERIEEQIRQLAARNHVRGDEARKLAVSITNEKEREVLRKLRDEYRKLPPEQQNAESLTLLADSLSAAGQFSQAQEMHAEAARRAAAENKSLAAKNQYQGYRDACELGQWQVALDALLEAARLDPAYRPFSLVQYVPKMILGTGGFGTVLRCEDQYAVAEERAVAVKTLHTADLAREVREVFAEAHIIKALKHPAIIGVRAWGCFDDDEARPFIVMEYFEGDSLAKYVRQHGKLEPGEAVAIGRQVASGMSAAHKARVYHRDLKPDNILVRKKGVAWEVRLIDFGLAVRQQAAGKSVLCPLDSRSASDRSYAGTFKYAPPEQKNETDPISGNIEKVGPYSDVYTFGKTFCEALFGTTAPKGFHYDKLPENYKPLGDLLERCTADAVEERFADFGEVLPKLDSLDPRPERGDVTPIAAENPPTMTSEEMRPRVLTNPTDRLRRQQYLDQRTDSQQAQDYLRARIGFATARTILRVIGFCLLGLAGALAWDVILELTGKRSSFEPGPLAVGLAIGVGSSLIACLCFVGMTALGMDVIPDLFCDLRKKEENEAEEVGYGCWKLFRRIGERAEMVTMNAGVGLLCGVGTGVLSSACYYAIGRDGLQQILVLGGLGGAILGAVLACNLVMGIGLGRVFATWASFGPVPYWVYFLPLSYASKRYFPD